MNLGLHEDSQSWVAENQPRPGWCFREGCCCLCQEDRCKLQRLWICKYDLNSLLFTCTKGRSKYTGEAMNPDGMIALLNYRVCLNPISDINPLTNYISFSTGGRYYTWVIILPCTQLELIISVAYFTFWKHGLKEIKLWFIYTILVHFSVQELSGNVLSVGWEFETNIYHRL